MEQVTMMMTFKLHDNVDDLKALLYLFQVLQLYLDL